MKQCRSRGKAVVVLPLLILVSACAGSGGDGYDCTITLNGNSGGTVVPVTITPPPGFDSMAAWTLATGAGKEPVQVLSDNGADRLVTLLDTGNVTESAGFSAKLEKNAHPHDDVFSFDESEGKFITISEDDAPVLRYIFGMHLDDGIPDDRTRSCYIHPVWGLDGEILTDDFPADHHHHRGIFLAWPGIIAGEDTLDLWHIRGVEKRFERWLGRETGPVFARLGILAGWYAGDRRLAGEATWLTIYRAGDIGRMIDFDITLETVGDALKIVGSPDVKGYGGFNYRPAPFTDPVITTCEGEQPDSDLRRFPWADFSALFEGTARRSGVAIFDRPDNINTPNGWCLRHYGFLGVSWPGNNPYLLQPGKPYRARYRVWIHRGDAEDGGVAAAFNGYVDPPRADITR